MRLSVKKTSGEFTPHPETEGTCKGVIVDVTIPKMKVTKYGERNEFRLVYETEVLDDNGKRYCIWSRGYTESLHEKSAFRADLKKIFGRDLSLAEQEDFDTECLIGMGVSMIVQHEASEAGTVYAKISFLGADKSGKPLVASGSYKRVKDRDVQQSSGAGSGEQAGYKKVPAAKADEGRVDWQKVKVHVGAHAGVDLGDLAIEAVNALIDNWLPIGKAMPKPLKADRDLIAALDEVNGYLNADQALPVAPAY